MNCMLYLKYGQSIKRYVPLDFTDDPRGALPLLLLYGGEHFVRTADSVYIHVLPTIV